MMIYQGDDHLKQQPSIIQQSLAIMKQHGLKYTKKRKEMLHYLIKMNRYVAAKEIYTFMKEKYQGISYDTIYRNLRDFVEINLLETTEMNGEHLFRFHCHQGIGHHHHFICIVCGKTRQVSMCPMDFFEDQLPGCTIEGHRFEILGRCENCQNV